MVHWRTLRVAVALTVTGPKLSGRMVKSLTWHVTVMPTR
jgi:hypothetical protein